MKRADPLQGIGFFIVGWLFIAYVVPDGGAFAQEASAARPSLEVRAEEAAKLFDAVIAAHQASPAYGATVKVTTDDGSRQADVLIKVRAKGGRLLMQLETGEWASYGAYADGRLLLFSTKNNGEYTVQPVPETPLLGNLFYKLSLLAGLKLNFGSQVLSLLDEWHPFESEEENRMIRDVRITTDADGKRTTILITRSQGPAETTRMAWTFESASHRLVSSRRESTYVKPASYLSRPVFTTETVTETVTEFSAEARDADLAPAPPAAARRIELPALRPLYNPALKKGVAPPPIEATDMEGKAVSLRDYQGKIVLLNFWATWCGPCIAKFPFMTALEEKFGARGFVVLGVACDEETKAEKAGAALRKYNVAWRNILHTRTRDGTPIAERYQVSALPFLMLIGRDGKIIAVGVNPGRSLEQLIERSIAADPPK